MLIILYRKHEWFQKDLLAYLFPSPVEQDFSFIETDAILEVCDKFGVKESEVHNALLSGDPHDQLSIAYHLIIDNRRIADEAAKDKELKDFYVASSPPPTAFPPDGMHSPIRPHPERIAPLRERVISSGGNSSSGSVEKKNGGVKRAKWHLGIRSQSKPYDIMNEVYRAMKTLDFVSENNLYIFVKSPEIIRLNFTTFRNGKLLILIMFEYVERMQLVPKCHCNFIRLTIKVICLISKVSVAMKMHLQVS